MENCLKKPMFINFRMKEIKPEGWLLNQLQIQAKGLSGNLDKFWPDIKDSMWIGGEKEGWERVPYWLDGFIPLAWILDDEDMKARARYYVNYIIEHQGEDGWICPGESTERGKYDVWALFLILKVLVVYYDATGDERIQGVVSKALKSLDRHIDVHTLFGWSQMRWFECLVSMWWLYDRTHEQWIIDLASKLRSQGFNWKDFFKSWPYTEPDEKGRWGQMSHVVNNAMMLKEGALSWRLSGDDEDKNSIYSIIEQLDKYHGRATGIFTGDECISGTSPVQGTELCAVAEYMYSLENAISVNGCAALGDRLEKIAFNALPATFSPDMWAHQYDQQTNQVQCSIEEEPIYYTNGGDSNIYGLEPNFGCCTANLSQPWPKLTLSTFMRAEDGIAAVVYAPAQLTTQVDGANVSVNLVTGYPFRNSLTFKVKTDREVKFSLYLRIPAWAKGAIINVDGEDVKAKEGEFYRLERSWAGETTVTLTLPMEAKLTERPNRLFAVERGPLVYSLLIGERWKRVNENVEGREAPHCDWAVYPTTPWNYGMCLNKDNMGEISFEEHEIGSCPFSPAGAPVSAKIKGRKVEWSMKMGSAASVPEMGWVAEEVEELTLIPYGCTNIRMTEMPLV